MALIMEFKTTCKPANIHTSQRQGHTQKYAFFCLTSLRQYTVHKKHKFICFVIFQAKMTITIIIIIIK